MDWERASLWGGKALGLALALLCLTRSIEPDGPAAWGIAAGGVLLILWGGPGRKMSAPERRAPCARPGPRGTIKGEYRERERERRDDTGGDPRAAEYPPVLRGQVHPSGGFCPQSASGEAGAGGKTVKRQEKAPASENADAGAFHLREIRWPEKSWVMRRGGTGRGRAAS